jgi:hypothetical protein
MAQGKGKVGKERQGEEVQGRVPLLPAFPLALGRWFSLLGLYEDMAWLLFGALVLIAIQAVQDWSRERNKNRPEEPEKPREPKRPSPFHALVVAYIRSFHERICPLIEITD